MNEQVSKIQLCWGGGGGSVLGGKTDLVGKMSEIKITLYSTGAPSYYILVHRDKIYDVHLGNMTHVYI